MDTSPSPTTSQSNETQNQYPEVRIRQNPQSHHVPVRDGEPQHAHSPPPNWRTTINMGERLAICRIYYFAGFFLLPLFWFVNFVWHYDAAYSVEPFEEQPEFKRYVLRSGIGFMFWTVLFVCWVFYFQTQRFYYDWDYLTFNFPTGSA